MSQENMPLLKPQEKIQWIETAKGLGILFVITVHSMIPDVNPATTHLSSFTIPLFFVMAGLMYNNDRYRGDLTGFVRSRARQYLIPYFVLYMGITCLLVLLGPCAGTEMTADQLLFSLAYGSGPPNSVIHLWFLPVCFFGLVLFVLLDRAMMGLPRQSKWLLLVILPLLAIFIQSAFEPALVPWHMNAILLAVAFMIIGNELRFIRTLEAWDSGSTAAVCLGLIAACATLAMVSTVNGFTDIAVDNIGASVWLYLVTGMLGSLSVFLFSGLVSRSKSIVSRALNSIGRYSQEVYEVHPVMFYLVPVVVFLFGGAASADASFYALLWPARLVLGAVVSLLFVELFVSRHRVTRLIFRGSGDSRLR